MFASALDCERRTFRSRLVPVSNERAVPRHPGTLPRGEGERQRRLRGFVDPGLRARVRAIACKSYTTLRSFVFASIRISMSNRSSSTRGRFLPLPGGEGRGEGKGTTRL